MTKKKGVKRHASEPDAGVAATAATTANEAEGQNGDVVATSKRQKRGSLTDAEKQQPQSKAAMAAAAAASSSSSSSSAASASGLVTAPLAVASGVVSKGGRLYLPGLGGEHVSECLKGAVPEAQVTPQVCGYGLYAEQLSGTSFTTPRVHNERSWFYRLRPTAGHTPLRRVNQGMWVAHFSDAIVDPNQIRWKPIPLPTEAESVDFVQGVKTIAGAGGPDMKSGLAIHLYACNKSMVNKSMCNSDGDLLFVPQHGALTIQTEFGVMDVSPGEIAVVQRGMTFRVEVAAAVRGYMCEIFGGHFRLPDLGPIGANGLANARDFLHPTAAYEDKACDWTMVQKFAGQIFEAKRQHSPFDVVGWFGNYVPYKYNLADFVVLNSVSVDHIDPSIFTVLTSPTNEPGVAACDFVIFPPRWCVQTKTFRPPYYHRNVMSEYMGNIRGQYDAKPEGFMPGGGSLHNTMLGHGPDKNSFEANSNADLEPMYLDNALAFMFETTYMLRLTPFGADATLREADYYKCWALESHFDPNGKPAEPRHG